MDRLVTWLRGRPVWAQDAVLAVALTVVTQVELTLGAVEGPLWAQRLAFVMMTGALAGRRLAPLTAAILGAAGMAAQTPLGPASAVGGFLALMVLTHSVALRSSRSAAVVGLAAVLVGVHLYDVLVPAETSVGDVVGNAAIFVTIWGLGRGARSWRHRTERLRDGPTPWSAPGRPRPGRRWPGSAPGSPGSCTTSSRTASA